MARTLSDNEFFDELARRLGKDDPEKLKAEWRTVQEYISEELRIYGFIHLPYFGKINATQSGGKMRFIPEIYGENKGEIVEKYIEPYLRLTFVASQRMKDCVNGKDVSRAQMFKQRDELRRKKMEYEEYLRQQECQERAEKAMELAEERRRKNLEIRERAIAKYKSGHQRKKANNWFDEDDFKE